MFGDHGLAAGTKDLTVNKGARGVAEILNFFALMSVGRSLCRAELVRMFWLWLAGLVVSLAVVVTGVQALSTPLVVGAIVLSALIAAGLGVRAPIGRRLRFLLLLSMGTALFLFVIYAALSWVYSLGAAIKQ